MTFSGSCPPTISLAHQLDVGSMIEAAEIDAEVVGRSIASRCTAARRLPDIRRAKGRPAARPAWDPAHLSGCAPARSPPDTNIGCFDSLATLYSGGTVLSETRRYFGIGQQLHDQLAAVLRHLVEQALGTKHGVSETRKAMGVPLTFASESRRLLVLLGREVAVEFLAQCGDHVYASIRKRPCSMICWPSTQMSNLRADHVDVRAGIPLARRCGGRRDCRRQCAGREISRPAGCCR